MLVSPSPSRSKDQPFKQVQTCSPSPEAIFHHRYQLCDYISTPRCDYPVIVIQVPYGNALVASRALPAHTIVEKFQGPLIDDVGIAYKDLSEKERQYVLNVKDKDGRWTWLIPLTNALYANHSCSPNAVLLNPCFADINSLTGELFTTREVEEGEEITFWYNEGEKDDFWDQCWNFECFCGSAHCQGVVDGYRRQSDLENKSE